MSSEHSERPQNPVVESDAVDQQARLGLELQRGQEQQNIEEGSIQATRDQQAGLGPARGAIQSTQAGLGHNSQGQQNVEQGSIQANSGDVVQLRRIQSSLQQPLSEDEVVQDIRAMLAEEFQDAEIRAMLVLSRFLRNRANRPTQGALGVEDNSIQARIERTSNSANRPTQGALGVQDNSIQERIERTRNRLPQQGTARHRVLNPQMPIGHPQQGRLLNPQMPNGPPQQGRVLNPQMPIGHPQQGTARRRMHDQQMPNDHPQQGTARRRMRLQVSSLHSVTDCRGRILELQLSDASSSYNEPNATVSALKTDQETRKLEGDIKGPTVAEPNYSTSSSLTSRLLSLTALMNLLLGLLGSYLNLRLSCPLN